MRVCSSDTDELATITNSPTTATLRNTGTMIAVNFGNRRRRSQIMIGRLSTARKRASADGSRIGAAKRRPYTMTTRHAMLNRTLMPGFWSIRSRIIECPGGVRGAVARVTVPCRKIELHNAYGQRCSARDARDDRPTP